MSKQQTANKNQPNSPEITDGIITDGGQRYLKFEGARGAIWVDTADLIERLKEVRIKVGTATGCQILDNSAIRNFLSNAQNWVDYRPGTVVTAAGWNGSVFVGGNGAIYPEGSAEQAGASAFAAASKFEPKGKLLEWQEAAERFVAGQPIPFFVCALALTGPILRFAPSDILNPQIEFVGEPLTGKSTAGIFASSIWSGNPQKLDGGGETWNMTPAAYDPLRRSHKDMFMLLDEGEGANAATRAELTKIVVFSGASGGSKVRYTDTEVAPTFKMTMLSTTNTPIRDVLQKDIKDRVEASTSRLMTLRIVRSSNEPEGMPVFETVPHGFDSARTAVSAMRHAADRFYGTAGPAFAEKLAVAVRNNEQEFLEKITNMIEGARRRLSASFPSANIRHIGFMSVIETAAKLAQEFDVLRPAWGEPSEVIEKVLPNLETNRDHRLRQTDALRQTFLRYFERGQPRQFMLLRDDYIFSAPVTRGGPASSLLPRHVHDLRQATRRFLSRPWPLQKDVQEPPRVSGRCKAGRVASNPCI